MGCFAIGVDPDINLVSENPVYRLVRPRPARIASVACSRQPLDDLLRRQLISGAPAKYPLHGLQLVGWPRNEHDTICYDRLLFPGFKKHPGFSLAVNDKST